MPRRHQFLGLSASEIQQYAGRSREIAIDTTRQSLVVYDGHTFGGFALARVDEEGSQLDFIREALRKGFLQTVTVQQTEDTPPVNSF